MIDNEFWMWADRGGEPMRGRLAEEMREAIGETSDDETYIPGDITRETLRKLGAAMGKPRKGADTPPAKETGTIFLVDLDFEMAYMEAGERKYTLEKKKMPLEIWDQIEVGSKLEFEAEGPCRARRLRVIY